MLVEALTGRGLACETSGTVMKLGSVAEGFGEEVKRARSSAAETPIRGVGD